jgi:hypothetical protein
MSCKHANRFTVRGPGTEKPPIKHEICRDCDHLIISVGGKITRVLPKVPKK